MGEIKVYFEACFLKFLDQKKIATKLLIHNWIWTLCIELELKYLATEGHYLTFGH